MTNIDGWLIGLGLPMMVGPPAVQWAGLCVDDILAAQRGHLAATAAAHPIGHPSTPSLPNRGYLKVGNSQSLPSKFSISRKGVSRYLWLEHSCGVKSNKKKTRVGTSQSLPLKLIIFHKGITVKYVSTVIRLCH